MHYQSDTVKMYRQHSTVPFHKQAAHPAKKVLQSLAEKIDCSAAFIGHVEAPNIKKSVSLDTLFSIAEALEVPVYKFFMFEEQ